MITYQVTAIVNPDLAERYEQYMKTTHLRDVLETGCFVEAILERAAEGRYRARYIAESETELERYLREHTATLRQEFLQQFPEGIDLSREVWTEVDTEHPGD
jgi:Domain of unknown function (DUF4286)